MESASQWASKMFFFRKDPKTKKDITLHLEEGLKGGLEGGLQGASRGLQGGFKGPTFVKASESTKEA